MKKTDTPGMFSEIATRYDLLNHVLSLNVDRLWRKDLVRAAELGAGSRVLDACTGTGDVAVGFAARVPGCRVVGIDRSSGMLAVGRQKIARRRLEGRIQLLEGDVLNLPFGDGHFDAVAIAFGLRNLPDYAGGISEMARVLKPGGRLLILEFCPPTNGLFLRGYNFYLRNILPVVGGLVSGSRAAYRYLATSIGEFLTHNEIMTLMGGAGLVRCRSRRQAGGIAYIYLGVKEQKAASSNSNKTNT